MDEQEFTLTLAPAASSIPLTGVAREELERALAGVNEAIAGDRAFFRCHPGRRHYTRLACEGETTELRLIHPGISAVQLQYGRLLAVVRQVEPGFRQRQFVSYPFEIVDADDADEEEAATLIAEATARGGP